jgi:diguanylate cyclase (GGDEF)-like protein
LPAELTGSVFGPFAVQVCDSLEALGQRLEDGPPAAMLIDLKRAGGLAGLGAWPGLAGAVRSTVVLALVAEPSPALCMKLQALGVTEVLDLTEAIGEALGRRIWLAMERRRVAEEGRLALSLDLNTGLPHQQQLLEHMSQLLALREREPASMALIVLELEGFRGAEVQLGAIAGQSLRRMAAVRLRAGLRASDVVASLGHDSFAVLLAWIDSDADGERVAQKLLKAISQPFQVAGQMVPVGVRFGMSQYPQHGKDAMTLLQQAVEQASEDDLSQPMADSEAD